MRPSLTTPRLRVPYGREQVLPVTLARRDPYCFVGAQTAPGPPRFITRIRQRRARGRPLVAIRRRGRVLPTACRINSNLLLCARRRIAPRLKPAGADGRGMPQSVYPWQSEQVCRGARGLVDARIRSTCVAVPFSTASGQRLLDLRMAAGREVRRCCSTAFLTVSARPSVVLQAELRALLDPTV
jgi:hypothetical protein